MGVPTRSEISYPEGWVDLYTRNSYHLKDPVAVWGFLNQGMLRWSEVPVPDEAGILTEAAGFGLLFGTVVSCGPITSRSICSFARADREHSDAEMVTLQEIATALHVGVYKTPKLTPAQTSALVAVAKGQRYSEAAWNLGITESALKARVMSARKALDARTTLEAVHRANMLGLL